MSNILQPDGHDHLAKVDVLKTDFIEIYNTSKTAAIELLRKMRVEHGCSMYDLHHAMVSIENPATAGSEAFLDLSVQCSKIQVIQGHIAECEMMLYGGKSKSVRRSNASAVLSSEPSLVAPPPSRANASALANVAGVSSAGLAGSTSFSNAMGQSAQSSRNSNASNASLGSMGSLPSPSLAGTLNTYPGIYKGSQLTDELSLGDVPLLTENELARHAAESEFAPSGSTGSSGNSFSASSRSSNTNASATLAKSSNSNASATLAKSSNSNASATLAKSANISASNAVPMHAQSAVAQASHVVIPSNVTATKSTFRQRGGDMPRRAIRTLTDVASDANLTDMVNDINTTEAEDLLNDFEKKTSILMSKSNASANQSVVSSNASAGLDKTKPTLVLYWADWCGYSTRFTPEWEKFKADAKGKTDLQIVDLNVGKDEELSDLASKVGVKGFPTLVLFNNKKVKLQTAGGMTSNGVLAFLRDNGI